MQQAPLFNNIEHTGMWILKGKWGYKPFITVSITSHIITIKNQKKTCKAPIWKFRQWKIQVKTRTSEMFPK